MHEPKASREEETWSLLCPKLQGNISDRGDEGDTEGALSSSNYK